MATSITEDYTKYRSSGVSYSVDDVIGRKDSRDEGANTFISEPNSISSLVVSGRSYFRGISVTTDGTNDAIFTVYDGITNSGTLVSNENHTVAGASLAGSLGYEPPIPCLSGIYVSFSGTGASYQVLYGD